MCMVTYAQCMEVAFRPSKNMKFVGVELAVAAYIFGTEYDPK